MSKASRPFRILALPLVRIPHGPLRTTGRAAAANALSKPAPVYAKPEAEQAGMGKKLSPGAVEPMVGEAPLMLYHVQQPDVPEAEGKPPIYQRVLDKAADEWNKLGHKPHKSWMYWFHERGEKLMDRINYEEWALKAIHEGRGVKIANAKKGDVQQMIEIPLLRPTLPGLGVPPLLPKLHRSLLHAIPYHRKSMIRCVLLSPLTWPFAIIPIIPNFPMFYVLWRAWSHYKAWRGATYLESLLKLGMITEKPSDTLNDIYSAKQPLIQGEVASGKGEAQVAETTEDKEETEPAPYPDMMIVAEQLPTLEKAFDMREQECIDIERAIGQASHRALEAEKVLGLQEEGKKERA
ncbi:hypothetical protein CspHIS471_0311980 [Cutaneotrichosporon sp. HIS471]|nr:hypothetical protein CspHIS471_0311980 [Cutaneotrichosporon sp. HIS471]